MRWPPLAQATCMADIWSSSMPRRYAFFFFLLHVSGRFLPVLSFIHLCFSLRPLLFSFLSQDETLTELREKTLSQFGGGGAEQDGGLSKRRKVANMDVNMFTKSDHVMFD